MKGALSAAYVAGLRRAMGRDAGWVSGLVLLLAYALKRTYSTAGADALAWVLAPSCFVAHQLSGLELVHEVGAGFISHEARMVVGPACAGVNFLIVGWLALYFTLQGRLSNLRHKLIWLLGAFVCAYVATVVTNGLRISLAALLYQAELPVWLTPSRAHRMLGVALYCSMLYGLCRGAELCSGLEAPSGSALRLGPLAWYGVYAVVVVGIPLANCALQRDPARFAEHALSSLGVAALVLLGWNWLGHRMVRLCWRGPGT
jgi:exosortase K